LLSLLALAALVLAGSAGGAPGDLDLTFDGDGKVITNIGPDEDKAYAVAVQGDGKIVAAGWCYTGATNDFCLARYNPDGSLDTGFDGDGKVTTAIRTGGDLASDVILQGDGKIVAAGNCYADINSDFCLARYSPDGSLDTGFDGDGKVTTAIGGGYDQASAVALQGDGKIVAAGYCYTGASDSDFCLARYNPDGSLDTRFGGDGKVTTSFSIGPDFAFAVALQGNGKIVAAGRCYTGAGDDLRFCLARYNPDGSLDTGFDGDGKVTTAIGTGSDFAYAVAIQGDGKIVAGGRCYTGATDDFCLARYNPGGSLDTGFDGDGKVTTAIGTGSDVASDVALQGDGKIVAGGHCYTGTTDFCLARYNPDGSLDSTFDGDGKVTTAIGTGSDLALAVAIQGDGKIVAAGYCNTGAGGLDFCLARYQGVPDTDRDGYWDDDETGKGSDPLDTASTPEHCDTVDNDGDAVLDEAPALSGRATPDPLCDPGADPDGDTIINAADTDDDNDGFSDTNERSMSTDEMDDCRVVGGHDAWPPDANADGDANVGDVIQLFGGGKILQNVGGPFYSARSDANANGAVNVGDVIQLFGGGIILSTC
jgi:uncharacterized delta-60 repeat protein